MSFLFPKIPAPVMPPIPPIPPDPVIKAPTTKIEEDLRDDIRRRRGRASTFITGSTGLTTEPDQEVKSLLGTSSGG